MDPHSSPQEPVEPSPDELAAAEEVGRAMARLFRAASRAKAHDVASGGDYHAVPLLITLREAGPLRANELADAVWSDPSTVSRQLAMLVERGYVERSPDPADRRATLVALTERGSAVLDARMASRRRDLALMLAHWPPGQVRRLADLLEA